MRAKAIAKLGFDYESVAALNPRIVYTNCYGYGRRGPERDLPAYDDTIQAECGIPAVQEQLTGEANLRRHHHGRQGGRTDCALRDHDGAVPPRAHRRGSGGRGQHVRDDGLFHVGGACQRRDVRSAARTGGVPADGRTKPPALPHRGRPDRRADLQRQALERFRRRGATAMGRREFATLEQRAKQIDTVYGLVAKTLEERTTDGMAGVVPRAGDPRRTAEHPGRVVRRSAPQRRRACSKRWRPRTGRCDFPACRHGFPALRAMCGGLRRNSEPTPRQCSRNSGWAHPRPERLRRQHVSSGRVRGCRWTSTWASGPPICAANCGIW